MVLIAFTKLCIDPHDLLVKLFHHPKQKLCTDQALTPHSQPSPAPANLIHFLTLIFTYPKYLM